MSPRKSVSPHGSTRDRILACAIDLVRSHGVDAVTIRAIATALEMTPMAVYKHFEDKSDLLAAVVWAGFERWEVYIARAHDEKSPRAIVAEGLRQYRNFALDEPRLFEFMFMTPRPDVPHVSRSVTFTERPVFAGVVRAVAELHQQEQLPGSPPETMLALWSMVHGLVGLYLGGRFGTDRKAFEHVFDGVVARTFPSIASVADPTRERG